MNETYYTPSPELLNDAPSQDNSILKKELTQKGQLLNKFMTDFKINGHVVMVYGGFKTSTFEIELTPGEKSGRLQQLTNDLQRYTGSTSARIINPYKNNIAVELPNDTPQKVALKSMIKSQDFKEAPNTAAAIGRTNSGKNLIVDLAELPHLLISGTTGSGKSVFINNLIVSLIYKNKPDQLKFVLIDPKQVEFSQYKGLPHLITEPITSPDAALTTLGELVSYTNKRYSLLESAGVRDIYSYNIKKPLAQLPQIFIFIDELSDLMLMTHKAIEKPIVSLAQKARAAGIHLIIATQRPQREVITGLIKANLPSRAALRLPSAIDSRMILDQAGAEQLTGKGDLLLLQEGAEAPQRVQVPYLSDEEIQRVVTHCKRQDKKY